MTSAALPCEFKPRRGKARLRLGISADLLTVHGRTGVTLLDLSETGARLRYEGDRISDGVLEWLGFEAFGSIVRHVDGELGLRFDEPVTQDCVLDTRELVPTLPQGEDEVRTFARTWVGGRDGQRVSAHVSGLRAEVFRQRAVASEFRATHRKQAGGMRNWLRAAPPFIAGGVLVGLFAGYWSIFL